MRPAGIGVEHREAHTVHLEVIAGTPGTPDEAVRRDPVEELEIQRIPHRLARLENETRVVAIEQRGHAAEVICVGVGNHQHVDSRGTMSGKIRRHDPSARIPLVGSRARIHHHPVAAGRAQDGRVALPYVEKM